MAKVLGHNARIYLGGDLLAHTTEVSLNFDVDMEEVTDADSGIWAENAPTLNRWNIDATVWYHNTTTEAGWDDVITAAKARTQLTLVYRLESGVTETGVGYITNVNTSGGTAGGHIPFTAAFIGTGELS